MEELKVRAKLLDEWVEGYFCVYCGVPQILVDESSWEPIDDIKTVGRYTGLCDKNGKKIFEGDIVQGYKTEFTPPKKYRKPFVATMKTSLPNAVEEYYSPFEHFTEKVKWEIIGNIHDNPELLKGGEG